MAVLILRTDLDREEGEDSACPIEQGPLVLCLFTAASPREKQSHKIVGQNGSLNKSFSCHKAHTSYDFEAEKNTVQCSKRTVEFAEEEHFIRLSPVESTYVKVMKIQY